MADIVSIVAVVASSGAAGWAGNVILEAIKTRGATASTARDADLKLEQHRDGLTFQLLEAARAELSSMKDQVDRLRPMEVYLIHFEEALMHIERMLVVPTDSENRLQIEREARAFLNRMRRGQQAEGAARNEIQRLDSEVEMRARAKGA